MKALLMKEFGKLELVEQQMPTCGIGEAIVKIHYSGICGSDIHILAGENPRVKVPLIPGHETCGVIHEINPLIPTDFKVGDKVTIHAVNGCGSCDNCRDGHENLCENVKIQGTEINGFFQEYVAVRIDRLIKFKDDVDMKVAALVEPLTIAVHDVLRSNLQVGHDVFVCGAGTIGTLIAKVAELQGARVLISESNDDRIRIARQNGLNVIDSKDETFMNEVRLFTNGKLFDRVFEVSGVEAGFNISLQLTKPGAVFVQVGMPGKKFKEFDINQVIFKEVDFLGVRNSRSYSMQRAAKLINENVINDFLKGMISKIFPKEEAIQAFELAKNDKTALKVLIDFSSEKI